MVEEPKDTNKKILSPIRRINQNLFLHIHSPRISPHSLKYTSTMGFGLALASLFLIMLITGLLLILNYTPSIDRAYDSVKEIIFVIPGGRFIRNIHRWSAHAMVLLGFLHMARVFYTSSYKKGRKKNWIIGVILLILIMLSNFSGYLLPWDQLAYWAVTIGSNIAASFREVTDLMGITAVFDPGGLVKRILIGGEEVGQTALGRFYAFHIIFFPLSIVLLMSWHFWRIRKDGGLLSPDDNTSDTTKVTKINSWPVLMWAEVAVFMSVLSALMVISYFADSPLLAEANPYLPENPAKSPWYFLGVQEMVSFSAFTGGILIPVLLFAFLFSIPYIDKEQGKEGIWFGGRREKRICMLSAIIGILLVVILYIPELVEGMNPWSLGTGINMILNPGMIFLMVTVIWSWWAGHKYKSTRLAALAMFTMAMVGIILFTIIGIWFRGTDWRFVFEGF